jgi:hypothetical protein
VRHPVAELRSAWADETSAPTQNRIKEKCIDPSLGVLRGARLESRALPRARTPVLHESQRIAMESGFLCGLGFEARKAREPAFRYL